MITTESPIIIGIDAGTSVMKAVAFTLDGEQIGVASQPNRYTTAADGVATQDMDRTWADCVATIKSLGEKLPDLARRTAAIAVTGQGDGTWLVGQGNRPVSEAWLWLDARAAEKTRSLRASAGDRVRFEATGTGLSTCQQGAQIAHMADAVPELLAASETAMHCKDWLFLNLTGVRATDPSEASLTFGNFRTRQYDETVLDVLGMRPHRRLLPPIVDGAETTFPLTPAAARETGLLAGTPVSLGFMDIVSTGIGAGVYTRGLPAACTVIGSTGIHMKAVTSENFLLNDQNTGYAIVLPVSNLVAQIQSNMAATLNIDWVLNLAADIAGQFGAPVSRPDLVSHIEGWLAASRPGQIIYHPYISEAGERGPFVNASARASLIGLTLGHRFADLVRAVVEGIGMASRDCYSAMGAIPQDIRLTGGAVRSPGLRGVLSAAIGAPVRVSGTHEAGAAGCAMMAAVAIGAYPDMDTCLDRWVAPRLGPLEPPDETLAALYANRFGPYQGARDALEPVWDALLNGPESDARNAHPSGRWQNERLRA